MAPSGPAQLLLEIVSYKPATLTRRLINRMCGLFSKLNDTELKGPLRQCVLHHINDNTQMESYHTVVHPAVWERKWCQTAGLIRLLVGFINYKSADQSHFFLHMPEFHLSSTIIIRLFNILDEMDFFWCTFLIFFWTACVCGFKMTIRNFSF